MKGLFLIGREIFDHPIVGIQNHERFAAWCWMLGEARYKESKIVVSGDVVTLKRGQLSCSIRFMSKRCGMSVQKIRTFFKKLETNAMINTSINTGQYVITICNYDTYQDFKTYSTQSPTHGSTQQQHSSNTAATQTRTKETKETKNIFDNFPEFWSLCTKKVGKAAAEKEYLKALKTVSHETIIESFKVAVRSWEGKDRKWIPKPANWLKDGSWDDEYGCDEETGQLEKTSEFVGTHPDAEMNLWKLRIKSFRERGFWVDMYGPTPDEPDCEAPAELLKAYREGKAHD